MGQTRRMVVQLQIEHQRHRRRQMIMRGFMGVVVEGFQRRALRLGRQGGEDRLIHHYKVRNPNCKVFGFHRCLLILALLKTSLTLPGPNYEPPLKLPHMSHLSFPETLLPRQECQSPLPRRKQARPRRRSGEMSGIQDLSTNLPKPLSPPVEETAENLCMKKTPNDSDKQQKDIDCNREATTSESVGSPELDLSATNSKDYTSSPPLNHLPPVLNMNQDIDNHSPLPFPPMPSVGALTMTPPHSKCKYLYTLYKTKKSTHQ